MPEPLTITEAAGFIRRGELTPSELLEQCLARVDRYEDRVRAWVYLDREAAREQAARLTDELKQNNNRGPLHGIPIGIKDIIDVFDMPTGCGSRLWANSYARRDATCVHRLREAGAVILGKTVTTPYAYLDPALTRNPWNLERTPGGSSSGSAAAVACGMCLAALATQTGGSTIRPASYCGVYSLKASYSRISAFGILPLASELDHVGIMANCVRDLAIVFQTIAGPDECNGWLQANREPIPDAVGLIDAAQWVPRELLRLGGMFDDLLDPTVRPIYEAAITRIADDSDEPARVVPPAAFAALPAAHKLIMAVGAAEVHAERLARRPEEYPTEIRKLIECGMADRGRDYVSAVRLQDAIMTDLDGLLLIGRRYFLTPATTSFAPDPLTTGNPAFAVPWSFTGLPTVSLPVGWSEDGLPGAIQLIGGRSDEGSLLATASHLESVLAFKRRPLPL